VRSGTDVNNEGQFKGKGYDGKNMTEIGMGHCGGMLVGRLDRRSQRPADWGRRGRHRHRRPLDEQKNSAMLPAGTELVMELSRPLEMTAAATGQ